MLTDAKIDKMRARAVQILGDTTDPENVPARELAVFVLQLISELRGNDAEIDTAHNEGVVIQVVLNKLLRKIGGDIEDLLESEWDVALTVGAEGERECLSEWLREQGKNDIADDVLAGKHNE